MNVSVLTLVKGRRGHLANMLAGCAGQDLTPSEMVVAVMDDDPLHVPEGLPFPVRTERVTSAALPLAAARNRAAAAARGELLVFLDVDCIPGPELLSAYAEPAAAMSVCAMGPVRYLAEGEAEGAFPVLWDRAAAHPARLDPDTEPRPCVELADHGEFWSLSFALGAGTFEAIGGFDEAYDGYGGEDTDFARRMGRAGVPLVWRGGARAVHQWHPVHKPPLPHFADIVRNARLFRHTWGEWPMDYWLGQMAALGLIDWTPGGDRLDVIRTPGPDDLAAARQPGDVRFS